MSKKEPILVNGTRYHPKYHVRNKYDYAPHAIQPGQRRGGRFGRCHLHNGFNESFGINEFETMIYVTAMMVKHAAPLLE